MLNRHLFSALSLSGLLATLLAAGVLAGPTLVAAQDSGGLVPDCGYFEGGEYVPCTLDHLIELINNVVQWLIVISIPLAALMFAYAGWLYISARGNQSQISRAHGIFANVALGLILLLGAWLVVYMIVTALVEDPNTQSEILRFFNSP